MFAVVPGLGAVRSPAADVSLGTPGAGSPVAPNTDCSHAICSGVKGVAMEHVCTRDGWWEKTFLFRRCRPLAGAAVTARTLTRGYLVVERMRGPRGPLPLRACISRVRVPARIAAHRSCTFHGNGSGPGQGSLPLTTFNYIKLHLIDTLLAAIDEQHHNILHKTKWLMWWSCECHMGTVLDIHPLSYRGSSAG